MPDTKAIGIYGLPASGKTSLLSSMAKDFHHQKFSFHELSEVANGFCQGGPKEFKNMRKEKKSEKREQAIRSIVERSGSSGKIPIVAGLFSLWSKDTKRSEVIWTPSDARSYKLILYLEVPPEQLLKRLKDDVKRVDRARPALEELVSWQKDEIRMLRAECDSNNIAFVVLDSEEASSTAFVVDVIASSSPELEHKNAMRTEENLA